MSNRCSISKLPSGLNNKNLFNTLNYESQLLSNNIIYPAVFQKYQLLYSQRVW